MLIDSHELPNEQASILEKAAEIRHPSRRTRTPRNTKNEEDDAEVHQYGILCLGAASQKDLDAFGTVTITADTPSVYDAVRSTARRMGLDLTEEELEWADDRISCWQ